MRFANPAETTGGSVGQRLGAFMICKGCLGVLGGSWKAIGVLGGPWGGPWGSLYIYACVHICVSLYVCMYIYVPM